MPGTRCTVAVCNNSFEKTKRAGMNIMYHQFPKNQPLRDIWIERCRRAGMWNPNSCHVCSIHFTENDYKTDASTELLNIPGGKKRLKSTAIPSLFLTEPPPLGLMSQNQRKRKKISVDEEESIIFNNSNYNSDSTIYFQLDDANAELSNEVPVYEICDNENSNQESVIYIPSEEKKYNIAATHPEDPLGAYYMNESQKVIHEEDKSHYTTPRLLQYVTVQDCATQTSPDYFLENYKTVVDKNESLENEILNWSNKYKKLMATFKALKSELQRLTLKLNKTKQS